MKKTAFVFLPFSILTSSAFLGLGMECLLNLLSLALAISLDGALVVRQYPRFIPFCIILGIIALLCLLAVLILNIIVTEKLGVTKPILIFEYVFSLALSLPMIKLWDMLFDLLRKIF